MSGIPTGKGGKQQRPSSSAPNSPITPASGSRLSGSGGKKIGTKKLTEKESKETPGTGTNTCEPNTDEGQTGSLNITTPLPTTSTVHRNLDKCPCGQSVSTWKLDCSKCHQYWHVDCVGLKGLSKASCNTLVEYLCPFCFVAPVSTMVPAETGACYVCRNTISLQQANSQFEAALASEKLKSLVDFSEMVKRIDFESLKVQMDTVEFMGLHLKHFLINKEEMKEHQERTEKASEAVLELSNQMDQLKEQVTELLHRPQPEQLCPPALTEQFADQMKQLGEQVAELKCLPEQKLEVPSAVSDEVIASISSRLDLIIAQEPVVSDKLESLRMSVDTLEKNSAEVSASAAAAVAAAAITSASTAAPTTSATDLNGDSVPSIPPTELDHGQKPVHTITDEFITTEVEDQLKQLFNSHQSDFEAEGGHAVLYFGEKYRYTGSSSSNTDQAIPPMIENLIDRINNQFCTDDTPQINSCLVNRYDGSESYLPKHSDNEATIHPDSQIITLSLGSECTVKFSDRSAGNTVLEHTAKPCSIYSMTRKSQEFFEHRIDPGSLSDGTSRLSLTFRSVSWRNRNATCIIGDSNTGGLKFGCDPKRSFGKALPGKRFAAPLLKDINPYDTCGYSNVVLLCGINDLKSESIKSPSDVRGVYNSLKSKISLIQCINPKAHVFICPVLPTKRAEFNRKGICFNNLIWNELLPSNFGVTFVDGFQNFVDENGLLSRNFSRDLNRFKRPDMLHLNWKGLAKLGSFIRNTVLLRKSGGVDRRRKTRVDGMSYRDVAANRGPHHDGYQA